MKKLSIFARLGVLLLLALFFTVSAAAQEATLPAALTAIEDEAFAGNTMFENVVLPETLTSIGARAFADCTALETIYVPSSVTSIGTDAFDGCGDVIFVCAWDSYAATYAQSYDYITVDGTGTIPVTLASEALYVQSGHSVQWCVSSAYPLEGDQVEWYVYHDGELASHSAPASYTGGDDYYSLLANQTGEMYAVCNYYHANGETTQLISETTQVVDEMSATLAVQDSTVYRYEYATWKLDLQQAAGNAVVQYSVYQGDTLYAQSDYVSDPSYRVQLTTAGTYTAEAAIVDALGRELTVQSASITVSSTSNENDPLSYQLNESGTYTVVACDISATSVTIPSQRNNIKVTAIGDGAFLLCENLTSVTLTSNISSIGAYAFHGCEKLTKITFYSGLKSIGEGAFSHCPLLTSISLGSITEVPAHLAEGCVSLTNTGLNSNITSIGDYAFSGCAALTSVTVYANTTRIGESAFANCTGLSTLTLGAGLTSLGENAFGGCTALTSLTLPDSLTSTGDSTFAGCAKLTAITLPETLTTIGERAFAACTRLETLTVPASVTAVEDSAFAGCTRLRTVTFENIDTAITARAFAYCSTVQWQTFGAGEVQTQAEAQGIDFRDTSIPVLDSVELITGSPTAGMSMSWRAAASYGTEPYTYSFSISCNDEIQVQSGSISDNVYSHIPTMAGSYAASATVTDAAGVSATLKTDAFEVKPGADGTLEYLVYALNDDGTAYTITGNQNIVSAGTEVVIPAEIDGIPVTAIGSKAFYGTAAASCITSVVIPDSVTTIGDYAFYYCSMQSLTLGSGVTTLGKYAFCHCPNLVSLTLPTSLTSIGDYAFASCTSLTDLRIPYGVTTLGNYMFQSCAALQSVTVPSSVTACGKYTFSGCTQLSSVVWNAAMEALPQALFSSCSSLKHVSLGYPITEIGHSTFSGTALTTLTGIDAVTTVEQSAFSSCTQLVSLSFPADADYITLGAYAFDGCTVLESVQAGNDTEFILKDYTFHNCTSLREVRCKQVTFLNALSAINFGSTNVRSFWNCASLAEIDIRGNVPQSAFYGCTGLETVNFVETQTIYSSAFADCASLKTVNFPTEKAADQTYFKLTINDSAFANCTALEELDFHDDIYYFTFGASCFEGCTALKRVTLPGGSGSFSLGTSSFKDCTALTAVENLCYYSKIPASIFKNCISLTDIDLVYPYPASTTFTRTIGAEAFANCESLTHLEFDSFVTSIGTDAFAGCPNLTVVTASGSYAETYFADADLVTPVENTLTPELSATLEWGEMDGKNAAIEAEIKVYNAKGGAVICAGDWLSAWEAAELQNVKLSVSAPCMSVTFPDGAEASYDIGSISYLSHQRVKVTFACQSDLPAQCDHGDITLTVTADGCDDYTLTVAADVQFPNYVSGDLVIDDPTTLAYTNYVSGDVYVNDTLNISGVTLSATGNVYVANGGTVKLSGSSRLNASEIDILSGGAITLNGYAYVTSDVLSDEGSLSLLGSMTHVKVTDFSVTGSGVLNMVADGEIATDTFTFNTTAAHAALLTNGVIVARKAVLEQGFYASDAQAFVVQGGVCALNVTRQSPRQCFSSLIINCAVGNLTVSGSDSLLGLPFECAHFGLAESAIQDEVETSNDIAQEIYEKATTARLEALTEAEEELEKAAKDWYILTLDTTNLTTDTLRTAQKTTSYAQKALVRWIVETAADSASSWSSCNDVINAISSGTTGAAYTFASGSVTYNVTVKPIGGLSATTAVASAGTITCATGGETYKFVYSLSPQGIQENGSALLKVLRKYAQEDFVKYLNKAIEEALGKENAKYALAVVKVVETGLIEEKDFLEVIGDKYGEDIAKKLIEQQFPKLKKTIQFVTKWEKYIKKADKFNTMIGDTRNGDALPTNLMTQFLELVKLVP